MVFIDLQARPLLPLVSPLTHGIISTIRNAPDLKAWKKELLHIRIESLTYHPRIWGTGVLVEYTGWLGCMHLSRW
jgi:hypothetical protein